uniref:Uncharacterized protein n=1 Tax=Rhizophora mucronata TaxID=61149 RepID=A0A2P2QAX4_RHIMU
MLFSCYIFCFSVENIIQLFS